MFGLPQPKVFVIAEDVTTGKPDPQGYFLGKSRLEIRDPSTISVFEDAPAVIKAEKAAGFKVIAVQASYPLEKLLEADPDWIVENLCSVTVKAASNFKVQIEIKNAFQ
ncbi:glycerol-3-phosphate phosphatase [Penicillium alfredii]|uniref:Glycerol-3-phosphate phosphatase n=1 Tax=Penicillium alfredii TaxID=1506179 RepID=A0A9W9KGK5_9EURO|nr:glycerol-3-phosphate phosphatase [Penicillium alfredii]KAJ5105690.1 glycerol-3-phosphate phosphatase [Penicillium alfredii]